MSFIREPTRTGLFVHALAIYREKRADQHPRSPRNFRMPRWAAWQLAWQQARNAADCGCDD